MCCDTVRVRRAAIYLVVYCLTASSLGQCVALADGFMVERKSIGKAQQMVASPRQEALLIREGDRIEITLRTSFRAGPEQLAWVVPVLHEPESVQEADDTVFTKLEDLTSPRFEMESVTGRNIFGCSGDQNTSRESIGRVAVTKTGEAGMYDYTVLTASGTDALRQWLDDHGYNIPAGSEPILKHYVDQGWHWLAIQLDAQRAAGALLAPRPIRYAYRDTHCIFPLIISHLSADESNEVLLYVLGDGYHECQNWATEPIPMTTLRPQNGTPSGTNYETYFEELTQLRGGHLFVVEFARDLNNPSDLFSIIQLTGQDPRQDPAKKTKPFYLTRLRGVISRAAMDRDVILIQQERRNPIDPVHTFQGTRRSAGATDAALVLALIFLVSLLVHRRKRRTSSRTQVTDVMDVMVADQLSPPSR